MEHKKEFKYELQVGKVGKILFQNKAKLWLSIFKNKEDVLDVLSDVISYLESDTIKLENILGDTFVSINDTLVKNEATAYLEQLKKAESSYMAWKDTSAPGKYFVKDLLKSCLISKYNAPTIPDDTSDTDDINTVTFYV